MSILVLIQLLTIGLISTFATNVLADTIKPPIDHNSTSNQEKPITSRISYRAFNQEIMMHNISANWFKAVLSDEKLIARLKKITLVVTDVDGSLTDGTVHFNSDGEADRMYSPQDGYAMRMAMDNGINVAVLSGNAGASIVSRAKKLKVPDNLIILGSHDKCSAVKELQLLVNATSEQTLIFGDDYLDAAVKLADSAVFFAMPNNSVFYLKHIADSVVPVNAGNENAFRLLLDLVLYVQGKHIAQDLITQAIKK